MSAPAPTRRSAGAYAQGAVLVLAMLLGSLMLWLGFPIGWLWIGSQLSDSSQPSLFPYLVVIVGLVVSVVLDYKVLVRLNARYVRVMGTAARTELRAAWLRSLRDDRSRQITLSVLDRVMVIAVVLAVCSFVVWFVAFSGSSLPGA